ncbi:MAG TPA: hypothetical protein VG675_02945 [Bryobacteraceae bacterium]|nr:hypothetical protein [Bryobacteraceae bacterium]
MMTIRRGALSLLFMAAVAAPGAAQIGASPEAEQVKTSDGLIVKSLRLLEPAQPSTLDEHERFANYLRSTFGAVPAISACAGAGIRQLMDSPVEWGTGGAGFGKRLANNMGYTIVRNSISYGASIPLHEDNRYTASDRQGFWPRTAYAVSSVVMARHPNGRRSLSVSSLAGIVGASLICQAWSPPSWRAGSRVATAIGITIATTAGFNVAREFVPDLIHYIQNR